MKRKIKRIGGKTIIRSVPSPISIEETKNFYSVRYRKPELFSKIRFPAWAAIVAESRAPTGSKVKMGLRKKTKHDWCVQAILIAKTERLTEDWIRYYANTIIHLIEDKKK